MAQVLGGLLRAVSTVRTRRRPGCRCGRRGRPRRCGGKTRRDGGGGRCRGARPMQPAAKPRQRRGPRTTRHRGQAQSQSVTRRALSNTVNEKLRHQHLDGEEEEKHSEQLGEESLRHVKQPSAFSLQLSALRSQLRQLARADWESLLSFWPGCGSGNDPGTRQMKLKAEG